MTSNMIHIVALGVGFKCPRKIHLNTQCPPPLRRHSLWMAPYFIITSLAPSKKLKKNLFWKILDLRGPIFWTLLATAHPKTGTILQ